MTANDLSHLLFPYKSEGYNKITNLYNFVKQNIMLTPLVIFFTHQIEF